MPDAARFDVLIDNTSCGGQLRYGAGDAGSTEFDRSELLRQTETLLEEAQQQLMKEEEV